MEKEILSPKNDLIFKMIFGDINNIDILADFLQAVLDIPPEDYERITLADPNFRIEEAGGKLSVLDLKVYTKSGKVIDIEIQAFEANNLHERIVYYNSKLITEQIGEGGDYKEIKKAITIVITDFVLIKDSDRYHNKYMFYDRDSGSKFTDIMEIHTLELPKIPVHADSTKLWNWLKFFNSERKEEYMALTKKNPKIEKAVGILLKLSGDERTRQLAEAHEKARRDERARTDFALEKGEKIGFEKGEKKGRQEGHDDILMMLEQGCTLEQIKERLKQQ